MPETTNEQAIIDSKNSSLNTTVVLVYVLQAIGLFTGIALIVGVIINYVKLDQARGTYYESHFRWQIRTFWFTLLFYVIGIATAFIIVGLFVLGITWLWQVYRLIKGALRLSDNRPMYQ